MIMPSVGNIGVEIGIRLTILFFSQMPRLSFGQNRFSSTRAKQIFRRQKFAEKFRRIATATPTPVARENLGNHFRFQVQFADEKFKQQFGQTCQGNSIGAANFRVKRVAKAQKICEWRFVAPNEWRGLDEVAAVADEVPVFRKA